ncbi:DUF3817 domain-containing protein [Blastomonas aquatica]|uniref:Acyl carrier protein n=1 Tax=Blastomonas aquatica TaxID=1510276 RepID=A0ABQ1J5H1_9SPHN|nr:hypothetical protein [Blastomonas aquatica]GGB58424.1 hypothetical protein GCM10010833_11490 [Blastomonas aquatica]
MQNTLDLDPEWGAIDLIEEVEKVFEFTVSKDEAERCATVGDLYSVICAHAPDWDAQSGKCASSMTFYRFRRSLDADRQRSITPRTSLECSDNPHQLFKRLSRETDLRLPSTRMTPIGMVGGFIFSGGLIAAVVLLLIGRWEVAFLAFVISLIGLLPVYADRGELPSGIVTVGDLVRRTAPLNARKLQAYGGRPSDRWSILASLAAEHGELEAEQIGPATFLHRKSMEQAAAA